MAKKIEVWAHRHSFRGEWFVSEKPHETKVGGTQKASTLVVHGDKHERVYTESEVRAMVKEMVQSVCAGEELTQEAIAAKHGIVLDPS